MHIGKDRCVGTIWLRGLEGHAQPRWKVPFEFVESMPAFTLPGAWTVLDLASVTGSPSIVIMVLA